MHRSLKSTLAFCLPLVLLIACAVIFTRPKPPSPPAPAPEPEPETISLIDPHVHAMSVTPLGLRAVAQWMEERKIERCIVSPLNHKGSRPQTEEERAIMLENFKPYRGRIERMTIIQPEEVETVEQAVAILEREIADGAIGFGEHYGVGLMFDDPKNLRLYEACEKVGLPVMFHIDQNKNMVEQGMERVDRVLKLYPKCNLIAHAYWWRQWQNGACDRQLSEHLNLFADMSGQVVVQVLGRDRKKAREFLIRHQDKILWATDEGWWSFQNKDRQMKEHYTFLEELDLPREVLYKIYRGNSEKVYGLKKPGS
jgi:predicted TIM-barrel fold metal-dependent hydrolase